MLHKYSAKTHVSLQVLKNGTSVHVTFTPITGGGSVYYTNDNAMAKALEKHYKYGKLYKKEIVEQEEAPVQEKQAYVSAAPVQEPVQVSAKPVEAEMPAPVQAPEAPKAKTLTFACYEDAKDYLVDTYGISRTKLRTQAAIQSAAKSKGITLVIE